jgi:hypothetical protein
MMVEAEAAVQLAPTILRAAAMSPDVYPKGYISDVLDALDKMTGRDDDISSDSSRVRSDRTVRRT